MNRILLIEDNGSIAMGLEYLFESEGMISRTAQNVKEARQALETDNYDLILLDVGLPDGNGFTLCQEIKNHYEIPVIFLTAKEEERDVVKGFDLGADDYVIKPFRNRELISRMKNVLRRNGKGEAKLTHGAVTIDTVSGKVYKEGEGSADCIGASPAFDLFQLSEEAVYQRRDFKPDLGCGGEFCE